LFDPKSFFSEQEKLTLIMLLADLYAGSGKRDDLNLLWTAATLHGTKLGRKLSYAKVFTGIIDKQRRMLKFLSSSGFDEHHRQHLQPKRSYVDQIGNTFERLRCCARKEVS
jgi:hypothetical protein